MSEVANKTQTFDIIATVGGAVSGVDPTQSEVVAERIRTAIVEAVRSNVSEVSEIDAAVIFEEQYEEPTPEQRERVKKPMPRSWLNKWLRMPSFTTAITRSPRSGPRKKVSQNVSAAMVSSGMCAIKTIWRCMPSVMKSPNAIKQRNIRTTRSAFHSHQLHLATHKCTKNSMSLLFRIN
jgi:hypothetical protein